MYGYIEIHGYDQMDSLRTFRRTGEMTLESSGYWNVKFGRVAKIYYTGGRGETKQLVICNQYLCNRIPCNYYCVLSRVKIQTQIWIAGVFVYSALKIPYSPLLAHSPSNIVELSWYAYISIVIPTAHHDGKRSLYTPID